MWRVTALAVKRAELASEEFAGLWFDQLAPAIAKASGGDTRLRQLLANVRPADLAPEISAVFPPRFDGLMEFWFETASDALAVMNALAADKSVHSAASGVVAAESGFAWLAEALPKKPENGKTGVKFLAGGDAAEGWTVADAQHYWSETHPLVAQTAPKVWGPLTRYTQFHGHDAPGLELGSWLAIKRPVPLCSDMGFAHPRDFLEAYTNDQYLRIVRPDEEKFSRPGDMLSFVSFEERSFL